LKIGWNKHKSLDALLVLILAQNRFTMMAGRFVASSPDFLWKSAAERRKADLTRQNRPQIIE
jgi:hypothetical protein